MPGRAFPLLRLRGAGPAAHYYSRSKPILLSSPFGVLNKRGEAGVGFKQIEHKPGQSLVVRKTCAAVFIRKPRLNCSKFIFRAFLDGDRDKDFTHVSSLEIG
jgi:hypothetical protein